MTTVVVSSEADVEMLTCEVDDPSPVVAPGGPLNCEVPDETEPDADTTIDGLVTGVETGTEGV